MEATSKILDRIRKHRKSYFKLPKKLLIPGDEFDAMLVEAGIPPVPTTTEAQTCKFLFEGVQVLLIRGWRKERGKRAKAKGDK